MKQRPLEFGFSLIELLVVVAIIGILASLLLPGLALAKGRARRAACASTEHQMGLALTMYVDDTGGFPPVDVRSPLLPGIPLFWQDFLRPYANGQQSPHFIRGATLHLCPEKDRHGEAGQYGYNLFGIAPMASMTDLRLGLGEPVWNLPGLTNNGPITWADLRVPTAMIAIGDIWSDVTDFAYYLSPNIQTIDDFKKIWLPANRHQRGANMLFCDGHVQFAPQKFWLSDSQAITALWNTDHLPHSELIRSRPHLP